jgi:HD superfamily phosphodiesterase
VSAAESRRGSDAGSRPESGAAPRGHAAADGDTTAWAARVPIVPTEWFVRPSTLHGVSHTQRVHIHAQRLTGELGWAKPDAQLVLAAALWHDIGRTNDDDDPRHGAQSAARSVELGLPAALAPADADAVLFAIVWHCLSDEGAEEDARRRHGARRLAEPERALRILWLLKDADALDRVRLQPWEAADPAQLRFPCTAASLPFARKLFAVLR